MVRTEQEEQAKRKYNFYLASFCYGGNGAYASELPQIRMWWEKNLLALKKDDRIGAIMTAVFNDTPITMSRNRAVLEARKNGADFMLMLDSDNIPDLYLGKEHEAVPFLQSSLDFLIEHYEQGPAVMFAPYCGPPPHPVNGGEENVYVFHWGDTESDIAEGQPIEGLQLKPYSREHAAIMRGIQSCSAGPTGCALFDMRAFEMTEPTEREREKWRGWFYYEWQDKYAARKESTEDVTATRDMGMAGVSLYCNWSAWAGHVKPKTVGRPKLLCADAVNNRYREAVLGGIESDDRRVEVNPGGIGMNFNPFNEIERQLEPAGAL